MRRWIAIIASSLLLAAILGGAGYFWLMPSASSGALYRRISVAVGLSKEEAPPSSGDEHPPSTRVNAELLVRKLGLVQDRITQGDREAVSEQYKQLAEIAARFDGIPADELRDPSDIRAALVYALSGGEPRVIQKIIANGNAAGQIKQLAEGIILFKERRPKKALEVLEDIDPRLLDRSLIGPVALAQSSLMMRKDPVRALMLLDEARLQAPHTAVEEAATRWQIPLLLKQGDVTRAMRLISYYYRKFGNSLYSGELRESLAALLAAQESTEPAESITDLLSSLESVDADIKADLFLAISRHGLLAGNLGLAKLAAQAVLSFDPKSEPAKRRAALYVAAADAPSDQAAAALAALDAIAMDQLEAGDVEMRNAVGQIARSVLSAGMSDAGSEPADQAPGGEPNTAVPVESKEISASMAQAEKAMKQADAYIAGEAK